MESIPGLGQHQSGHLARRRFLPLRCQVGILQLHHLPRQLRSTADGEEMWLNRQNQTQDAKIPQFLATRGLDAPDKINIVSSVQ